MKNQIFKFRCRLLQRKNILWWNRLEIEQDFEYVIGGYHYESIALDEISKYLKDQFGWWPRRIGNENMKSDKYWQIDLVSIRDRGLALGKN